MSKILKLLAITAEDYFDMYFGSYWRWCESVSINDAQTQMVLANALVNKYYNMEYAKCEKEFLYLLKDYPNTSPEDARKIYNDCTFKMFNRRCLPIINKAKKTQIQ